MHLLCYSQWSKHQSECSPNGSNCLAPGISAQTLIGSYLEALDSHWSLLGAGGRRTCSQQHHEYFMADGALTIETRRRGKKGNSWPEQTRFSVFLISILLECSVRIDISGWAQNGARADHHNMGLQNVENVFSVHFLLKNQLLLSNQGFSEYRHSVCNKEILQMFYTLLPCL